MVQHLEAFEQSLDPQRVWLTSNEQPEHHPDLSQTRTCSSTDASSYLDAFQIVSEPLTRLQQTV